MTFRPDDWRRVKAVFDAALESAARTCGVCRLGRVATTRICGGRWRRCWRSMSGPALRLVNLTQTRTTDPELFAGLVRPCRFCGLLEASRAAHEQAVRLDPGVLTSVGHTYWMMGDHGRALTDTFGDIGYLKGVSLLSLGRREEAIDHLRIVERAAKNDRVRIYLTTLRALAEGNREESLEAADRAAQGEADPEALYYLARACAYLGETDRALAGVRRTVDMGFFCYPLYLRDPWLDSIRASGDFNQILRTAEARHREAAVRFAQAGGDRVLGLRHPL